MPARRAFLLLPVLLARPGRAAVRDYVFDQESGRIGFTARHFGLLTSQGRFTRFQARLRLDPDRPATAEVSCEVDTASATVPFPGADELLHSEAFFDVARHPRAVFTGTAAGDAQAQRFTIAGALQLRGVQGPLAMQARLVDRSGDAGGEVARFAAEGTLSRSAFGMVAERTLIGDAIGLSVEVRIRI